MDFCFASNLQIDSIFDTFHFMAIQRGVKFILPVTVYGKKMMNLLNS